MTWNGRFLWHDLMTLDRAAAAAFYTELLGWQLDDLKMGPFTLSLITVGGRRIGTLVQEEAIPHSHWMPYVAVADVDDAVGRVDELGGHVCMAAMDNPPHGRFAVLDDPHGAYFSVLKRPADSLPPDDLADAAGAFGWDELLTPDPEAAARFYRGMFGWNVGSGGRVSLDHRAFAGFTSHAGPAWLACIAVDDVDGTTERALQLGARLRSEPGPGRVIADPTGALVALYARAAGRS